MSDTATAEPAYRRPGNVVRRWCPAVYLVTLLTGVSATPPVAEAGSGRPACPRPTPDATAQTPPSGCRPQGSTPLLRPEPGEPVVPRMRPVAVPRPAATMARRPARHPAVRARAGTPRRAPARPAPTSAPQPGNDGGTPAPAGDAGRDVAGPAADSGPDARFRRSLVYSGALGLALALVGMAMVTRRRRFW